MSLPAPLPGLVIRYRYLWADDAASCVEEGDKERPAVVVMTIHLSRPNAARVFVLPIMHAAPARDTEAMEIPAPVCHSADLDEGRCWVILSEFNTFAWPGFDLALVPGRTPRTVAYGFLTPGFFARLRDRWLALDAAKRSRRVPRDT